MLNVNKLSSSRKENCFIQDAVIIIKWIIYASSEYSRCQYTLIYDCHLFVTKYSRNRGPGATQTLYSLIPLVNFISLSIGPCPSRKFYRRPPLTFGKGKSNRASDEFTPDRRGVNSVWTRKTGLSGLGRAEGKKPRDGPVANVYRTKPRMYERVNHRCGDRGWNFGSACVAGGRRSRRP